MTMTKTYFKLPATTVWAVLLIATLITWALGAGHALVIDSAATATVFVLLVAFAKVDLVGRYFMELNHAPRGLARLFHGWSLATSAVVIGIYLLH
jgi:hypothetical protein